MRAPYVEGSSDPPRPRVMAANPQGCVVSVDRGTRRPAIELRNHPLWGADLVWWQGRQHERDAIASRVIGPTESETLSMCGSSMHENREIPSAPVGWRRKPSSGRSGKASGHNPDMHAAGKSDTSVVPVNAGNNARRPSAAGYDGTVNPPRNRKSGTGNPPSTAGPVARPAGRRTGWRKGW
jgi:hypothetical protein